MDVLIDTNNDVTLHIEGKLVYHLPQIVKYSDHEKIAATLASSQTFETCMLIIESKWLAKEHFNNPAYMHKTNEIWLSEAMEKVRNEMTNQYLSGNALRAFLRDNELLTWKYNYKEEDAEKRKFKHEVEDAVFLYQEQVKLVENMVQSIHEADTYLLDEEGYILHEDSLESTTKISWLNNKPKWFKHLATKTFLAPLFPPNGLLSDEDGNLLCLDNETRLIQRGLLLHKMLKPRVGTTHERVYDLPNPFNHWDSRSYWHQFFVITNTETNEVFVARGNCGSSGAREENGRYAHTFAQLSKVYGIETPTYHLIYNEHNKLKFHAKYDTFKTLGNDLSGNYISSHSTRETLFADKIITSVRSAEDEQMHPAKINLFEEDV